MRILLACPYAWDDPGGVQVHVRELGERLRSRGHEVLALTPARHRPSEPWVVRAGWPLDVPYNRSNAPIDPRPWSLPAVRRSVHAFAPDVVHAHEPLAPSTSMWATIAARAPVVATFHSGAERSRLFDVAAPALRRVARRLVTRIAVSERAAAFARARIGGDFEVIPNGADVARFEHASPRTDLGSGPKLLFVGRLHPRKGFPVAIAAFGELAVRYPDLRLVVAGDGEERTAVEALPEGTRARVTMLGAIANTDLPPISAACDVYVGPSMGGESFGVVLVEAMAAGLPVVASDTPGYDEVVRDEVDGLLVPVGEPHALAAGVARVLDDPALAERLRRAGSARARAFDWSTVVQRLEAVYDDALERGPARLR